MTHLLARGRRWLPGAPRHEPSPRRTPTRRPWRALRDTNVLFLVDTLEPRLMLSGDTLGTATALSLTQTPANSGSFVARASGDITPANQVDYWSFQALAGDVISLSADTPASTLNPRVELRNNADGVAAADNDSGPDQDAFLSHFLISTSGTYFVRVTPNAGTGAYDMRVDLARNLQLESDAQYANDSIAGADRLTKTTVGSQAAATIGGTVMAAEGANTDEDTFFLGNLNAANTVDLSLRLPAGSLLDARLSVLDAAGNVVNDTDAADDLFTGTLPASGGYYARVEANGGSGTAGQYLLDARITDQVAPRITAAANLALPGYPFNLIGSSITLSVDEDLDPASVNDAPNYDFRAAGGDDQFDTADDVLYTTRVFRPYTTGQSIALKITDGDLAGGRYRLTVQGLRDFAGNTLDGDGNGTGGDPYLQITQVNIPSDFAFRFESASNDVRADAVPLVLIQDAAEPRHFFANGIASQDPVHSSTWSDEDWWSFAGQAGDAVALRTRGLNSGVDPYVELWNPAGAYITGNSNAGPGVESFISGYVLPTTGTYFVRAGKDGGSGAGNYALELDLARGTQMETDSSYNNDATSNADSLSFTQSGNRQNASVAGLVMAPESTNVDEDRYTLGLLNTGNVIELDLTLPNRSNLDAKLRVLDASGTELADEDGDPNDAHYMATVTTSAEYYAEVSSQTYWVRSGRRYELTPTAMTWTDAENHAVSRGGHLVAANDAAEWNWVWANFRPFTNNFWIGLNDVNTEGTFEWTSGEPVTFTNWTANQPDNGGNAEHFVHTFSSGQWNDVGSGSRFGVIELDAAGTPDYTRGGPLAHYVLDMVVSDPVPPQITGVTRLQDGGSTSQLLASWNVSFSEKLASKTASSLQLQFGPFDTFGGHTYVVTPGTMSFTAAQSYAANLGGTLVAINDDAEQQFVASLALPLGGDLWIGLAGRAGDDTFVWDTDEQLLYTNWWPGYPQAGTSDAVVFRPNSNAWWYNTSAIANHRAVVEIPNQTDADNDSVTDALDAWPNDSLNGWDVREAGTDGQFDTNDDTVYQLQGSYDGNTTIRFRVLDGPMGPGDYRFTLRSSVTDVVGNPLDGDGDATGGDDFVRTFSIDPLPAGVTFEGRDNASRAKATPLTLSPDGITPEYLFLDATGFGSQDPTDGSTWSDEDWWSFDAQAGDAVAVHARAFGSSVDPYMELYNTAGNYITGDSNGGPGVEAYISGNVLPATGTYFVRVGKDGGSGTGNYVLELELARGASLETDLNYHNDTTSNADPLTFNQAGNQQNASVAGLIMASEGSNLDEDRYALGLLNVGNLIELNLRLPSRSDLDGQLRVFDASGTELLDEDGAPNDGHFIATVAANGQYYAEVKSKTYWVRNGRRYELTPAVMTWQDAEDHGVSRSGHLIAATDAAEWDWVWSTFSPFTGNFWIGLNDVATEGTFEWTSGEPVSFTKWNSGEPNNSGNEDFAHTVGGGKWNDVGSGSRFGVIELDAAGAADRTPGGPLAHYVLDVVVSDPVPPLITGVTRLPDGGSTSQLLASWNVSLSEKLASKTASSLQLQFGPFDTFGGHTYVVTPGTMSFAAARSYAANLGGTLVAINDDAEQQFVASLALPLGGDLWIGLADRAGDDTFVWETNEQLLYTNWWPGYPQAGTSDAVVFRPNSNAWWYNTNATGNHRAVIEIPNDVDADNDGISDALDAWPTDPLNGWDVREAGTDGQFDTNDDTVYQLQGSYDG
ncbi:MAG: hypothetical protein CMJ84_11945, partial [Planctomycetes bacterium]|nr:hypothetical protein [Planctomycetota bacterium]